MSLQGIHSVIDALKVAADLRIEDSENDEYDRALCDFIADFFGTNASSEEIAEILGMTWHLTATPLPTTDSLETDAIVIAFVCDGPPGATSGRFIEVEDSEGRGIKWGDWVDRGDGTWALIGPAIILLDEQDRSYERQGEK
jgi:hypothetical protein